MADKKEFKNDFSWSFSRDSAFNTCKRKYYYSYYGSWGGWNKDADVFIMGHTHMPEVVIWVNEHEKIKTYVNTGDWVEHSTYVLIKDGQLRLKNYT